MITSMISSMIKPMVTTMVNPDSGGAVFSPLTVSYDSASFTPVIVSNTEIISFHVKGLTTLASSQYIMSDPTTGAHILYRGSDGRFRVVTDTGNIRQINYTGLNDGGEYFVELRIDPLGWDLYVDSVFIIRSTGSMQNVTCSKLGENAAGTVTMTEGAVFGVTLGGSASWPMQSASDNVFDGEDMIGSNNLTYNGAPGTITSADTIETTPL